MILINYNSTILISAYNLDESHGSEPMLGFNLLEQSLAKFHKTILVTSNTTNKNLLEKLEKKYQDRIEIHVVKVQSVTWEKNTLGFYPIYRKWQKSSGKYLEENSIKFDLGIHATLGTFLFGTGLSLTPYPYVYGPAGFSSFDIRYGRAFGGRSFLEILRNIVSYGLLIFDPFVRKSLYKADLVIAGDLRVKRILKLLCPKIELFQNPITHYQSPGYDFDIKRSKNRKVDLIWVGRFIERKDPIFALEVLKEIKKTYPNVHLTMVGEGRLQLKIEGYIEKFNLSDSVDLTGWVEKIEVLKMMKAANLMMFTSFRETAGVQLFESNSVGTRVVALGSTGASSWYASDLIRFIPAKFFESRRSLVRKFASQVIVFNSQSSHNTKKPKVKFEKIALIETILSSLIDHQKTLPYSSSGRSKKE